MTSLTASIEGTGPIHVPATPTAPVPFVSRRRLAFASLGRRARRRAVWLRDDLDVANIVELPLVGVLAGIAGVVALTLAMVGLVVVL